MEIKPIPKEILIDRIQSLSELDIFLPELYFITQANAFPGALLPTGSETLTEIYQGAGITPILPIKPSFLEYRLHKDLIMKLQVHHKESLKESQIEFVLNLSISDIPSVHRCITKVYVLEGKNAIEEVPVLEVWPNFLAEGWKEYYVFYYEPSVDTFKVQFDKAKENYSFKGMGAFHYPNYSFPDTESNLLITQLTEFPSFINCCDKNQESIGLIFLKTPREVGTTSRTNWKVGVDFNPSFTNVYVERNSAIKSLDIEPLHLKVTESFFEVRDTALREYFIPESIELPISTILTTRGSRSETLPILNGRIYVPDRYRSFFNPNTDYWIRTNLNWSPDSRNYNHLFLKHLILQIVAQATLNNANQIQWVLATQPTFSEKDRTDYIQMWKTLTEESYRNTGMHQICPQLNDSDNYLSRRIAVSRFFSDFEIPGLKRKLDLVNSTCMHLSEEYTDISIWEDNRLIYSCLLDINERNLFSQFIYMNPGFLERQFKIRTDEWRKLKRFQFYVILDVFMRRESEGWLRNRRDMVAEDPEFQGLLQLIALGMSGLYYYIGLLIKALYTEGKYKTPEITPVFAGGNGSKLLNWLAKRGEFNRYCKANTLFSAMLSQASGFENIGVNTVLSPLPKDEVACGLVLNESHLKEFEKLDKNFLIAGEAFTVNGETLNWNSRMQISGTIDDISVPQLTHFLNSFHRLLDSERIKEISPFKGYQVSEDPEANTELWQTTTSELKKTLLRLRGNSEDIRVEHPFILELKALLQVLGNRWADEWK